MNSAGDLRDLPREGLPHSEIPGSKPVCGSPRLIAACHVLHRFSAPRHPPSTLSSLTIKYLRRESFLFLPDSLVKDRDHRGSKSPLERSSRRSLSHPRGRIATDATADLHPIASSREVGGAERDRTADLRLAKPPLSQLSYSPRVGSEFGLTSLSGGPR